MTTPILMPRMPSSSAAATLTKWLVKEGDAVSAGDVIAEIAAGHLTMEVEASDDGIVQQLLVEAGAAGIAAATPIATLAANSPRIEESSHAADEQDQASRASPLFGLVTPTACRRSGVHDTAAPAVPDENASRMTYREAIRASIVHEMHRDPAVVLIGRDLGVNAPPYSVAHGLAEAFGTARVVDVEGGAEAIAGTGIGAAMAGLRPVVEFSSWAAALPALERIVSVAAIARYASAGRQTVPIVFRAPNGVSEQGGPHLAMSLAAWLAHVPGLKVVAPVTPADAKGLLAAAIRDPDPVLLLEHDALYNLEGAVPLGDAAILLGKARILRAGSEVTLIGYSRSVLWALEIAEQLGLDDISAEVIDLTSLRPLDLETVVLSVRKTGVLVTLDEGWPVCSIASEVTSGVVRAAFRDLRAPPLQFSAADTPMPYAASLATQALPSVERAVQVVRAAIHGR